MATEQEYDDIIAPMLLEVAKKCDELGMSLVARVEWGPGEAGITQIGKMESVAQVFTQLAAHSRGNVDAALLGLIKRFDVSASVFLYKHNRLNASSSQAALEGFHLIV